MTGRRIAYGAVWIAALLCQIFDIGYLVHFTFVLVSCLPFAGLLLSLPAMLACRARLAPRSVEIRRGEPARWDLTFENKLGLTLPCVSCRLRLRCAMTGETWTFRMRGRGVLPGGRLSRTLETERCGRIEGRVTGLWVCDCLGIFALPVRTPAMAAVLVCPVPVSPGPAALPEGGGTPTPAPRGRSASGEEYELRPYRPGDSVRAIHWKASARRDEPVVREMLEQRLPLAVLTFDHFGAPEEMERTLDRLAGLADLLLSRQRPFEVRWAEPEGGAVRRCEVSDRQSWRACLTAILSDGAPARGRSILEQPLGRHGGGRLFHIHVTGEEARHDET